MIKPENYVWQCGKDMLHVLQRFVILVALQLSWKTNVYQTKQRWQRSLTMYLKEMRSSKPHRGNIHDNQKHTARRITKHHERIIYSYRKILGHWNDQRRRDWKDNRSYIRVNSKSKIWTSWAILEALENMDAGKILKLACNWLGQDRRDDYHRLEICRRSAKRQSSFGKTKRSEHFRRSG